MFSILERGLQTEFEEVIMFLMILKLNKKLRFASDITTCKLYQLRKSINLDNIFKKKEKYPKGLYIVVKEQCKVGL